MHKLCEIFFDQFDSLAGVVNKMTVLHPSIDLPGSKLDIEYLHVGKTSLSLPFVLDGYVCAIALFAMQNASLIKVHGPISRAFARNIRLLSEAWACWLPEKYSVIEIEADKYLDNRKSSLSEKIKAVFGDGRGGGKALSSFSGGADAAFTLFRHALNGGGLPEAQRFNIEDVVMVHGFDVGYDNQEGFDALRRAVQPVFDKYEVNCHVVKTNIRNHQVQLWGHSFMAQLSSVLHQFSGGFKYGLVGSSEPYTNLVNAWGSHPGTDFLLSGDDFEIVHDGAGFSRTEKIFQIGRIDALSDNLHICWENPEQDRNCGRCEKCIRTKLNFIAAGYEFPRCFDEGLTVEQVQEFRIVSPVILEEFRSILSFAARNGRSDHPLIHALNVKISNISF